MLGSRKWLAIGYKSVNTPSKESLDLLINIGTAIKVEVETGNHSLDAKVIHAYADKIEVLYSPRPEKKTPEKAP